MIRKSKLYTNTNTEHVIDTCDYTSPIKNGDDVSYEQTTLKVALDNLYDSLSQNITMGEAAQLYTMDNTSNKYLDESAKTYTSYSPIGGLKNPDGSAIDIYNMSTEMVLYYLLKQ